MRNRRQRRRTPKTQRHAPPSTRARAPLIVREATSVERLAYSRTQAAEALGISRSTFDRRVLPLLETVEMPWGTRLIPADELQRLLAEQRRPARETPRSTTRGRPTGIAVELVARIRSDRAAGKSLAGIARELDADLVPTAHGGARWWPSTVAAVLRRSAT